MGIKGLQNLSGGGNVVIDIPDQPGSCSNVSRKNLLHTFRRPAIHLHHQFHVPASHDRQAGHAMFAHVSPRRIVTVSSVEAISTLLPSNVTDFVNVFLYQTFPVLSISDYASTLWFSSKSWAFLFLIRN
jgi:hypothetical protein